MEEAESASTTRPDNEADLTAAGELHRAIADVADIATETGAKSIGVAMLLVVLPTGEVIELIVGEAAIKKWREKN